MQDTTGNSTMQGDADDRISILDLLTMLGQEKMIVFGAPVLAVLVTIVYSLTLPGIFTAKTVVLPPSQSQSGASSALAGLSALSGAAGGLPVPVMKSSEELYASLLTSESVQRSLIDRLKLMERYRVNNPVDAARILTGSVTIKTDRKSGLITIEVDDGDPAFAAQLANAHVEELRRLLGRLAVTEAQQRRLFFEQHLVKTKDALTAAEMRFRRSKEKSGIQVTESLLQESVGASVRLRGQIVAREVQLESMRSFAGAENPQAQAITSEIAAMRAQLQKLERGGGGGDAAALVGQESVDAYRDVRVQQAILEADMRQLEIARSDEAREGPLLQQVDVALVPDRKSKPHRRRMVTIAAFVGFGAGIVLALTIAALRRATRDPVSSQRLAMFVDAWLPRWPRRRSGD